MRQAARRSAPTFLAALVMAITAAPATAGRHPALVDPATTACESCHDDVLTGAVRHRPAVDDCRACHWFQQDGSELTVVPMAVGAELCTACHGNLEAAAAGSLAVPHAPVTDDCGSCHNPHASNERGLLLVPSEELCGSCHDPTDTDALHPIPVSRAPCQGCHAPHGSAVQHMLVGANQHRPFAEGSCDGCHRKPRGTKVRLLMDEAELCLACHGDVAEPAPGAGVVHAAVEQGRCTACHDPHVSASPGLLRGERGKLCFSCHSEVQQRAAGVGRHAAVDNGCDGCHEPHRSAHTALLVAEPDELCAACHDVQDQALARSHYGADMSRVHCDGCHDPHGSRVSPLIADGSIHEPIREGCSSCHAGSAAALEMGGGNALCEACHSDVVESATTATVSHPAMEAVECIDCHTPHASREHKLLRAPSGEICTSCHEEQAPQTGLVTHGAIDWIGCHSCHEPHGGETPALLRARGNELCNGCHLAGRVRFEADGSASLGGGFVLHEERASVLSVIDLDPSLKRDHPIPDHPVAGIMSDGGRSGLAPSLVGEELTCRMCHDPHSAPSSGLFAFGATTQAELCLACHPR